MLFGRLPPRPTLKTVRRGLALARALDTLGPAPASSDDWTLAVHKAGGWRGPLGNDVAGNCVVAGTGHQIILHTANAGKVVVPTAKECLDVYYARTGGKDTGLVESEFCDYLVQTGFLSQKEAAYSFVDPANLDHVKWCVQLFGACRLGITVTQQVMDDFNNHLPWSGPDGTATLGGHDVPIVRYTPDGAVVNTWGEEQLVLWPFLQSSQCTEEAYGEVWPDWMRAAGTAPNNFDLKTLLADLKAIADSTSG